KYRAFDNAGNAEAVNSQLITITRPPIDTTPPTSTIACNGAACSGTPYSGSVSVTLAATDDPGGSGAASIRYTTDGSDPTATTGTVTASPSTASSRSTSNYCAFDNAGNADTVNSQPITLITIDTTPPTSTIACNGAACSGTPY